DMFSLEEQERIKGLAKLLGLGLGGNLEGIPFHPISFNSSNYKIQETDAISNLEFFNEKILAVQAVLAYLKRIKEINDDFSDAPKEVRDKMMFIYEQKDLYDFKHFEVMGTQFDKKLTTDFGEIILGLKDSWQTKDNIGSFMSEI
ncbi:MAG: hypothetical protein HQL29_05865, partial [Candidatus Omnitrophica bacterium]|nr:hypothetical protein [Candidatus Omnitrophota bacterium]